MAKKLAKTVVINQPEADRSPFLRGILVRSLVQAGLPFDDAYSLAREIRADLSDTEEIASGDLHIRVSQLLDKRYGKQTRLAYERKPVKPQEVIVKHPNRSAPFSVGLLTHCLEACAIPHDFALASAREVHRILHASGRKTIGHNTLRQIIYECLEQHAGEEGAERYLSWRRFKNSGKPLIILIGGASGVGKSTVTAEVAFRLDIVRTQSTDMMREIIRAYLAPHVVPTLGYSSFEAWRGVPNPQRSGRRRLDNPVIAGFLSQFANVRVALESTINRAINEHQSLIIDGVLALPWELNLNELRKQALVVPVMLAVMRKKLLARQLARRGDEQAARKASRYLEQIDNIWELQYYLLSQADMKGFPIIPNWTLEITVREVLGLVSQEIMKQYPAHSQS